MGKVSLEKVKDTDRTIFMNLFNLYHHDRAKFFPELYPSVDKDGYYDKAVVEELLGFEDSEVLCYLIKFEDKVAGLAVISFPPYVLKDCDYCIQEIFVLNNFRGKGIAHEACKWLFKEFPGRYCALVAEDDVEAQGFWDKIIPKNGKLIGRQKHKENLIAYEFEV